jgi:hypothetical protein
MHGRAEALVRHFMLTPPRKRSEYFIRDGAAYYGSEAIEDFARKFNIDGPWK